MQPSAERAKRALGVLVEYEAALRNCDLTRLARVWIMSPLERQMLQGVCAQTGKLNFSVSEPDVNDDAEVSIDFTHNITYPRRSGSRTSQSRLTALIVERADGEWAIWKIRAAR